MKTFEVKRTIVQSMLVTVGDDVSSERVTNYARANPQEWADACWIHPDIDDTTATDMTAEYGNLPLTEEHDND